MEKIYRIAKISFQVFGFVVVFVVHGAILALANHAIRNEPYMLVIVIPTVVIILLIDSVAFIKQWQKLKTEEGWDEKDNTAE